ncbi:MAG: hypothetical protein WAU32_09400, partial [Thermoanaerobaculia bacterium]
PGQPRPIRTAAFSAIQRAAWFPGGESLLLSANEPGRAPRLYIQPAAGGDPRAITPEGIGADWAIAPDGLRVAALDAGRRMQLYPIDGGEPVPAAGAEPGDAPIRFSPDGRFLYVFSRREGGGGAEIHRITRSSGAREAWREIEPADPVGLYGVARVFLSADGQSYVYAYVRFLDQLYLVDGLR